MENRIRQILEDQIYSRGYGGASVGGARKKAIRKKKAPMKDPREKNANRVQAALGSPWVKYLKCLATKTGVPYNELMMNQKVKNDYKYYRTGKGMDDIDVDYVDYMGSSLVGGAYKKKTAAQLKASRKAGVARRRREGNTAINKISS